MIHLKLTNASIDDRVADDRMTSIDIVYYDIQPKSHKTHQSENP